MTDTKVSLDLLNKYNISVPRYTSYPTAPEWTEKLSQQSFSENIDALDSETPIALYVHIPFCEKLCWYCGCNTIIKKQKNHSEKYVKYLIKEIELVSQLSKTKLKVGQLHWGGGSPNFLTNDQTIALLDKIDECFDIDYDGEIAIEIDPRTTNNDQIELYSKLGFNRVSMGIQSFNHDVQVAINRIQPYERIAELVDLCRNNGFKSINFDLIYGLPKQTAETFYETLEKTKTLSPDRIALYSFACLPQVIDHHKLIKDEDLPDTQDKFQLFLEAREFLAENGYLDIAMDHFAKEDDELAKAYKEKKMHRNFMGYTVQDPRDSIGFGLSSISYVNHNYIQNIKSLDEYYDSIDNFDFPIRSSKQLKKNDLERQWIINRLMCTLEVNFDDFEKDFKRSFKENYPEELKNLEQYIAEGFVIVSDKQIKVTKRGQLFSRNICSTFDSYIKKSKRNFSKAV
ncbi:MAG: oxygen-independent coproporphyrinogen III oxidase [Lentisphaeraceae bacterium]|nr:oxygen-independent coproporphyrinogen III oxidase [Lentisphaeraceae bacterium]